MDKQTIIDKHIKGSLSQVEKQQFDVWMKEDQKFMNDVGFYENLSVVVQDHEKEALKSRLEGAESKLLGGKKKMLKRILLILLGLLLLTAVFLGLRMEKMKSSPAGLYASNYEVYPNVYFPVTRGQSDEMTKTFMAYEAGNYGEAARLIEERLKTSSAIELKFYQAIAYGEIGNLPLAIGRLEDIRRFDSPYVDESYWYLGLYYLKQGNHPSAIDRFQTFYELSNDIAKKKAAEEIIGALQKEG